VPAVKAATGALVLAEGPHRPSRVLNVGEAPRMEGSNDTDFKPDRALKDGETVSGSGWTMEAVTTPGHTKNHMAFAFKEKNVLFSGDHVMAWSTPVVAPPDGSMGDYMASLDKLRERSEQIYFPGHGGAVSNAPRFVAAYILHRKAREAAIVRQLEKGESDIPALVGTIYASLDPRLTRAAGMSVLAHLEDLVARGTIETDGPPSITSRYRFAG
jgi:glyoxylase-like metal-dependent hydrolase (beta-lactamase superfamily II)